MSFCVGNVILLVLNIPLIGLWVRMLTIPYHLLYPSKLLFICIGAYTTGLSPLNVWMVTAFGAIGFIMRILRFPGAPLLLGFVLGPLMEEHFRRAMVLSRGDFATFIDRPISATIMALTGLILVWGIWTSRPAGSSRAVRPAKTSEGDRAAMPDGPKS